MNHKKEFSEKGKIYRELYKDEIKERNKKYAEKHKRHGMECIQMK